MSNSLLIALCSFTRFSTMVRLIYKFQLRSKTKDKLLNRAAAVGHKIIKTITYRRSRPLGSLPCLARSFIVAEDPDLYALSCC